MKHFTWGIAGGGIIAQKMLEALLAHPHCSLEAVASRSQERAAVLCQRAPGATACTYEELAANTSVQVVYIATTHNAHYTLARLMLQAGKHVLVEKPFTVNAREAAELISLSTARKCFLMEAMWSRFLPAQRALKELIEAGTLGEVRSAHFDFGVQAAPRYAERLYDKARAGGVLLDMGIYPISLAAYYFGESPLAAVGSCRYSSSQVDVTDHLLLHFARKRCATIATSFELPMHNDARIYGSLGYVVFPNFQRGDHFYLYKHGGGRSLIGTEAFRFTQDKNGFFYQLSEVCQCLSEGKLQSGIMPLSETLALMKTMDDLREQWKLRYPSEED